MVKNVKNERTQNVLSSKQKSGKTDIATPDLFPLILYQKLKIASLLPNVSNLKSPVFAQELKEQQA